MKFNKTLMIGLGVVIIAGAGVTYSLAHHEEKVLTKEEAQEIVLEKVPNGNIIELVYDGDETPEYDSKVSKENVIYDVDVDAKTGEIIGYEEEIIQQNNNNNNEKLITEQQAKEIMAKKVPDAKMTSFYLDKDKKDPEYEGKLVKGDKEYEVNVDAKTGDVKEFSHDKLHSNYKDESYGELEIKD